MFGTGGEQRPMSIDTDLIPTNSRAVAISDPSVLNPIGWNLPFPREDMQQQVHDTSVESVFGNSKKLEDDMQQLGEKIKHHEDNINYLKTLRNKLEDSIVDSQGDGKALGGNLVIGGRETAVMSSGSKSRGKKEERKHEKSECRSVEGISSKGSTSDVVESCIDSKSLFIGSKIGEGAHGKVYQGRYGDRIVAIKVLHCCNTSEEKTVLESQFVREVAMMSKVKHENLVKAEKLKLYFLPSSQ